MHDQLAHRVDVLAAGCQVQVADDVVAVGGQQMSGPLVRQLTQHLFTDRRDPVGPGGGVDQLADLLLIAR